MNPDTYRVARGKSVLDVVKDDLATLERFDMSRSDRMKLSAWKELLNRTSGPITTLQCNAEVAASLGATRENVDAVVGGGITTNLLTDKVTDTLDRADIYSSVAALAAVCNANPVIVLKYPSSYVYRGLGIQSDHDILAHRIGNSGMSGTCVAGVIDMLLTIVQVGSAGGYFKTGWAANVEDGSPELTRGNSEALRVAGTPTMVNAVEQSTGTDPRFANAPINKYYCNLMNALGVKAGADGFPRKGGNAEVTKFGMYDRTEDFFGGGSNPPAIHDPGEFTALKACPSRASYPRRPSPKERVLAARP